MSKVIAFWGSHNSGVTTLVCGFTNYLTRQKQNVAVVCCDTLSPTIAQILPQVTSSVNDKNVKSIGKLLSSVEFSENDILRQCITTETMGHVVFLGYAYGENKEMYPQFTDYDIFNFYSKLSNMVDFVLVDCSPDLSDRLTSIALESADNIIRVGGTTYKDLSYFASNLNLCPHNNTPLDQHVIVFPKLEKNDSVTDVVGFYGAVDYTLKYSQQIKDAEREGTLLTSFPAEYISGIKIIVEEMGFIE